MRYLQSLTVADRLTKDTHQVEVDLVRWRHYSEKVARSHDRLKSSEQQGLDWVPTTPRAVGQQA